LKASIVAAFAPSANVFWQEGCCSCYSQVPKTYRTPVNARRYDIKSSIKQRTLENTLESIY